MPLLTQNSRTRSIIITLIFTLVFAFGFQPEIALSQREKTRLVLAFYYTWFDENTWSPSMVPDMPLSPYLSRDPATMEKHVEQAKSAGIDSFVVSWLGPQKENNQTETNLQMLLDVAQSRNFSIAVDFELTSPFYSSQADIIAALDYLLDTHAQHPAFLRYAGKPVIFFWRQQNYDIATWIALRQQVDPEHTTIWIAEGVDLAYQEVFDGHHLYNITWNPPTDPAYTAAKFHRKIDEYNAIHATSKLWIATVMPGYDDTRIAGRPGTYIYPRQDGNYYQQTWQAATASNPEMIIITSFNEWPEGTMIEPSITYGDLYLNLTRNLSDAYRQGVTPLPTNTPTRTPLPAPTETLPPAPTPSPTPTETSSPTPTLTPTPYPSPTLTATPTFTTVPTRAPSPPPAATPTPTPTSTPLLPSPTRNLPAATATSAPQSPPPDKSDQLCFGTTLLPLAILITRKLER